MRKSLFFLIVLMLSGTVYAEKDRLAVMDVTDEDGIFAPRTIVKVTDYIFSKLQETKAYWMVPMVDRDNALEQAIEETVKGSRKECVDEKCQLSLVAQLQANFLINTKIKKLYEGTCNITISKFDVEKRAGVDSWIEKFNCTEKGVFEAVDGFKFITVSTNMDSDIPDNYDEIIKYLDDLLNSSKSDFDKILAVDRLFSKEYFSTNGIRLIVIKLNEFPILSEKLFSTTMSYCEQGKMQYCYYTGRYFNEKKDYKKAFELYKKACDGGEMNSCANLGVMYNSGDGVSENKKKAVELYKKACDGGGMNGCYNLGWMYINGEGVAQDKKKAFELYKKACDSENINSCANLGVMYNSGDGVSENKKKAVELYKKACDGGGMNGCANLGWMYSNNGDKKKAVELYKKACDGGEMTGCANLGVLYDNGDGVTEDKKKAAELYKKACDGGVMFGCAKLGFIYYSGDGVTEDKKKAAELYKKACDGGVMPGCSSLGFMCEDGEGVAQDKKKAFELYKKACDGGHMIGCSSLGRMCQLGGNGVPQNKKKAVELYKKACDGGDINGCRNLGGVYYFGDGMCQPFSRLLLNNFSSSFFRIQNHFIHRFPLYSFS